MPEHTPRRRASKQPPAPPPPAAPDAAPPTVPPGPYKGGPVPLASVPPSGSLARSRHLYVFRTRCRGCLYSNARLVSPEAADNIVEGCVRTQRPFTCHVATMAGKDVTCRAFYEDRGDALTVIRLGDRLGLHVPVQQPPYPLAAAKRYAAKLADEEPDPVPEFRRPCRGEEMNPALRAAEEAALAEDTAELELTEAAEAFR